MKKIEKMEKMEAILDHILNHLDEEIICEDLAAYFSYNPIYFIKIFKEYFEFPFRKFVNKLKMRRAAKELCENKPLEAISKKYGYTSSGSFAKAFRKELGVSPRDFVKRGMAIPDMPARKKICGIDISIEYVKRETIQIAAYPMERVDGGSLDIFHDIAYACGHPEVFLPFWDEAREQVGVWWGDGDSRLYYLLGHVLHGYEAVPADLIILTMPGDDYAVFHIGKGKDHEETLQRSRMLARFIRYEWIPIGQKVVNYLNYIYEVFGQEECRIYIPLSKGMGSIGTKTDVETALEDVIGIDNWIRYIDEHIQEDLTVCKVAEHFYYSQQHFADIFRLYYGIGIAEYIGRRKLYWIAQEITDGHADVKKMVEKYHFRSYESFAETFSREFGIPPEKYGKIQFDMVDLVEYYSVNKDQLAISYVYLDDLEILGMEIKTYRDPGDSTVDIPGLCTFYFCHDPPCLEGTVYACRTEGEEDKIALWHPAGGKEAEGCEYSYILGPVVKEDADIPEGMKKIAVTGGRYAVFGTADDTDRHKLETVYRMMTICVLYGWIKEYRVRVDFRRITFMRYLKGRLYAYVPLLY